MNLVYISQLANMKTFLAVTFFFRILTFAFAIGGDADDIDTDNSKCDEVTPMSGFDSNKYFGNLKHMYATHARYGARLGVCLELHTERYPNGTISCNYDFNGNGKSEEGINSYIGNCTITEDSTQNGKFSFNCIEKYDLDLDSLEQKLLKEAETDEVKAIIKQEIEKERKADHKVEFTLKVTVLSTDYEKYSLIHRCDDVVQDEQTYFVDNYVVFNVEENAGLPEKVKEKFKEYKWQEDKFDTRKICKENVEIKK